MRPTPPLRWRGRTELPPTLVAALSRAVGGPARSRLQQCRLCEGRGGEATSWGEQPLPFHGRRCRQSESADGQPGAVRLGTFSNGSPERQRHCSGVKTGEGRNLSCGSHSSMLCRVFHLFSLDLLRVVFNIYAGWHPRAGHRLFSFFLSVWP